MIGQHDDLDGFLGVIEPYIVVGMRIFVGADCAGEQRRAGLTLAIFRLHIRERTVFGSKALRIKLTPISNVSPDVSRTATSTAFIA